MTSRSNALAVIAGVFLIGCLIGIAGHHFWEVWEESFRKNSKVSEERKTQAQTERLTQRLRLNSQQEAQLKTILDESRREIYESRAEWESTLRDIRAHSNEKIIGILNDEQKNQFRLMLKNPDSRERANEKKRGDGDR